MDKAKVVANLRAKARSAEANASGYTGEAFDALMREAQAALSKAVELAAKYGIADAENAASEDPTVGGLSYSSAVGIQGEWFTILCESVSLVVPVRFSVRALATDCVIIGEEADALLASELLDTLINKSKLFFEQFDGLIWHEYLLGFAFGCLDYAREHQKKSVGREDNNSKTNLLLSSSALVSNRALAIRSRKLVRIQLLLDDMQAQAGSTHQQTHSSKSLDAGYHDGSHHKKTRVG